MSALDYLMEAPHYCDVDDANAMTFKEATTIIKGHDTVEDFLAYNIWPLSDGWDFEVEKMEMPLLKVIMSMPKVAAITIEREMGQPFRRGLLQWPTSWLGIMACLSIVLARLSFDTTVSTVYSMLFPEGSGSASPDLNPCPSRASNARLT
jgi:hypothetical protein